MRFLLRPGWLAFIALVVGFAVTCYALLAPWQFGREEQRQAQERAIAQANAQPPVPLRELVPPGTGIGPDIEWRQVSTTGTYLPDAEAVVRLLVVDGRPAVEVLTPLQLDDGRVVVVNRGYVAAAQGQQALAYPAPPSGTVTVTGRLRPDHADPSNRPAVIGQGVPQLYAADSRALAAVAGLELVPGYVQLVPNAPGALGPLAVEPRVGGGAPFTNFSYALQWLTFGLIALVALGYFIRLEVLQRRARRRPAGEDAVDGGELDAGETPLSERYGRP